MTPLSVLLEHVNDSDDDSFLLVLRNSVQIELTVLARAPHRNANGHKEHSGILGDPSHMTLLSLANNLLNDVSGRSKEIFWKAVIRSEDQKTT